MAAFEVRQGVLRGTMKKAAEWQGRRPQDGRRGCRSAGTCAAGEAAPTKVQDQRRHRRQDRRHPGRQPGRADGVPRRALRACWRLGKARATRATVPSTWKGSTARAASTSTASGVAASSSRPCACPSSAASSPSCSSAIWPTWSTRSTTTAASSAFRCWSTPNPCSGNGLTAIRSMAPARPCAICSTISPTSTRCRTAQRRPTTS